MGETLRFDPSVNFSRITLVGCGGTGAQWARSIARIVYDMRRRGKHIPQIKFIDPDRVEAKNVGRQLFTSADIGQYKAEVLARRFSLALGLDITWEATLFAGGEHTPGLLCGAVDSHQGRAAMAEACARSNCVWIDAGNHNDSGQVVIGNGDRWKAVLGSICATKKIGILPHAGLLFPALLKPEKKKRPKQPAANCAIDVEAGDQDLLINDMIATVAAQYTWRLLNMKPITTHVTYIASDVFSMHSWRIQQDALENLAPQKDRKHA